MESVQFSLNWNIHQRNYFTLTNLDINNKTQVILEVYFTESGTLCNKLFTKVTLLGPFWVKILALKRQAFISTTIPTCWHDFGSVSPCTALKITKICRYIHEYNWHLSPFFAVVWPFLKVVDLFCSSFTIHVWLKQKQHSLPYIQRQRKQKQPKLLQPLYIELYF